MSPNDPSQQPMVRSELADMLRWLGVAPGDVVLVHASLSSLGYLVGGAHALCLGLMDVLGSDGTLVMPGFTPQLCHPATWRPERLVGANPERLGDEIPPFSASDTPVSHTIGVVPECLRGMAGTLRSNHPHTSFLARGRQAAAIVGQHPLSYRLSGRGPLGELWRLGAKIIMLGSPWTKCTALHLAEYVAPYPGRRRGRWPIPIHTQGNARWDYVDELLVWEGDFAALGADFEAADPKTLAVSKLRHAVVRAAGLRELVGFAENWLMHRRDLRAYLDPPGWRDVQPATDRLPLPGLDDLLRTSLP